MTRRDDIAKALAQTKTVYERQAERFDNDRSFSEKEVACLNLFNELLPDAGHVLDLGCGTGEPIAAWLIARGHRITGTDFSEPMLEIAAKRFPRETWVLNDMRALDIEGSFDGIISWHGSFHLTQDEQRTLLPKLARRLASGGALMLTIGPSAGEVTGTIGGERVYHASLDPAEYRALLMAEGLQNIRLHTEENEGPLVVLAQK